VVWSVYGGVIKRTGTGEFAVIAVPTGVVFPLPHPATFSTVTSTFPYWSAALMKTWRNPTIVTGTGVGLKFVNGLPVWSKIGTETIELLAVIGMVFANPVGLPLPGKI
jgi:hypothetical protein